MPSKKESRNYLAVFNAINDAIFIHDADTGAILEVNEAMLDMYGYERSEVTSLTIGDLSMGEPPYDHAHALAYVRSAIESCPQVFEWKAKKKNGLPFWVEVSLSCTRLGDGRKVLAVVRDITDRKQSELLHKETQRLLKFTQLTVHQARIAVFWCHADGYFFYVNDTSCEWLQYSREELMAMHVADINPEFPRAGWLAHWQQIKEEGMVQMESVHRRKNGEVYPLEIYSKYVRFEGKEYKLAFVHDISAQKKAQEEKAGLEAQLRQTQKMEAIGTLAGGVAHDLNNMLSPVLGYAEMMLQDLPREHPDRKKLTEIFKAGIRAKNLTRQLLTFGRKQPLEIKTLDLNDIIAGFENMLRRTIREDIEIVTRLGGNLPAIEGDLGQIEQVLLNLAVNAQDAMPDGGTLTIETAFRYLDETFPEFRTGGRPGPYLMMAVSDTGEGIPEGIRGRIFEPFFTTKAKGQGTGLGLSTTYGIVKKHDGYLWTYTEPGQGSTFKVFLPRSAKQIEAVQVREGQLAPERGHETILIAEDQDQVLDLAAEILTDCGYTVLEARDGQSAMDAAGKFNRPIHLLLTDVVMPDMNGKALYRQLAEIQPRMKVLFMSGYTDNVIVHHGLIDEDIEFISKPFGVQDLAAKVRATIDK